MNCPQCHGKGQINQLPCNYNGCHNGFIHCCDGDKEMENQPQDSKYKNCRWCNKIADVDRCWGVYTEAGVFCQLCGKDVTGLGT